MALLKFPKMLESQIRTQLTKGRTDTCFQPSSSIKKKSGRTSEVMTKRTTDMKEMSLGMKKSSVASSKLKGKDFN